MGVHVEQRGGIAIVTIANPPVNVIGVAVRQGLLDAVAEVRGLPGIRAAIITGGARAFAAGADAREFDGEPLAPHLPEVANAMEASGIPWIAAISGPALGGGLELALACAWRIASPGASLGLPEVKLGIVPGAGGTQRLPRLIGFAAALPMIAEGRAVTASEALALGLVDEIADDPLAKAMEAAGGGAALARLPLSSMPGPRLDAAASDAAREQARKKSPNEDAPLRAIELVEMAARTGFAEGSRAERATFLALRQSPQAKALRHIFFAERGARMPRELTSVTPVDVRHAAVVGGGTMGAGIAYALILAGIRVTLVETSEEAARRAEASVGRLIDGAVRRGLATEAAAKALTGLLTARTDYEGLRSADLAIEAVFEDMAIKRDVFARLDAAMPAYAILATNTSYLDVNAIAASVSRPERVIGLHFFSPAHIMRLLEIVRADATSDTALATAFVLASRLKKLPVVAGVCDGFIGNRILARAREIADMILMDGGLPWEIDEAMVAFGYAMGPYAVQDLSGLDIAAANRKRLAATRSPARRASPIADRMVAEGRLGRKTGAGWYRYPGGEGPVIDPLVADLIAEEARFAKVERRRFSPEEIQRRLLAAMIDEAAGTLHEGIARSAGDIDLVTVHGYGFPRWRGGLMHFAGRYGFANVVADIEAFSKEAPLVWRPGPGLLELAGRE